MKHSAIFLTAFLATSAHAVNMDGSAPYTGKIGNMIIGDWNAISVSFQDGSTCNGRNRYLLKKNHPWFDQMYSLLLTAKASDTAIVIQPRAGDPVYIDGNGNCVFYQLGLADD